MIEGYSCGQGIPDMFPEELPGLPLEREVEMSIDTLPGVPPIA
jgi:hypothetical protein